jgi:hypothetical protein
MQIAVIVLSVALVVSVVVNVYQQGRIDILARVARMHGAALSDVDRALSDKAFEARTGNENW